MRPKILPEEGVHDQHVSDHSHSPNDGHEEGHYVVCMIGNVHFPEEAAVHVLHTCHNNRESDFIDLIKFLERVSPEGSPHSDRLALVFAGALICRMAHLIREA